MQYEWYEEINNSNEITQGDILLGCPVAIMDKNFDLKKGQVDAEIKLIDGIILTQACDLKNNKVNSVLICPIISKANYEEQQKQKGLGEAKIRNALDNLKNGKKISQHIINKYKSDTYEQDYYIVDFTNVYTIPVELARKQAGEHNVRLRLCPPYREHLSQAFARFFMRVGLPIDIRFEENN